MSHLEEYTGLSKNKVINGFIAYWPRRVKKKKERKSVIDTDLKSNRFDVKSILIIY